MEKSPVNPQPMPMLMPQWLTPALSSLGELATKGRMPHALLLAGDRLAQTLAVALGQQLLCQSVDAPCQQCQSCGWVSAGSHPDLVSLTPESKSGQILIEQTRGLARNATLTAAGQRIFIISPAHAMNNSAANSLLKTLEEPPANTLIILCTSRRSALPATILSRCQTVLLPSPEPTALKDYLLKISDSLDESEVEHLLTLAHNSVDDVLDLMAQETIPSGTGVAEDLASLRSSSMPVSELAAQWISSGSAALKLSQLARLAQEQLKDCVLRADKNPTNTAPDDLTNLWGLYDATNRCRALLETSARSELQLEALLLKWRNPVA